MRNLKQIFLLLVFATLINNVGWGQINMSATGSNTQNFNTLLNSGSATWSDNSTISNWFSQRTGTGTNYLADAGSSTAGNLYSYGTDTNSDRALGTVGSGNATAGNFAHGVLLRNTSGNTITDIKVTYTMEQWRKGGGTTTQSITFWYKISTSSITSLNPNNNTGWTQVTALTTSSPINTTTGSALDGNLTANKVTLTNISIPSLSLANNEYIMLKWEDPDHGETDHGLAIDDVTIAWTVTGSTPTITLSSPSQIGAGNVMQGATNHILSNFQAAVTVANATLNSLAFTSAGTYSASDLTNFKLWYNGTSNTFADATQLGSAITTSLGTGSHTFSSLTQAINSGTTGYFWVTCDVSGSAVLGNTINVAANPTLTFAGGTPTGSITVGGTQTITGISQPTVQASNIVKTSSQPTQLSISWTNGNGTKRIVKINTTNSFTSPVDGTDPTANTVFGGSEQVIFNGSSNSVTVTSLSPQTRYWFRVYEYNGTGTSTKYLIGGSTDNPKDFYTLSSEPGGHPNSFSANTFSSTQINLNWTLAIPEESNTTGYLIIKKTGSTPTGSPTDAQVYTVGNAIGDGTVAAIINSRTTLETTITGLTAGTTYYFKIFPFGNATNSETYNYKTDGTPKTANATTTSSGITTYYSRSSGDHDAAIWSTTPDGTPGSISYAVNTSIVIQSGHTIVKANSNDNVYDVTVESGGKLWAGQAGSNVYFNVYGNIICNGQIGNGSTLDAIGFNIEGPNCTLSGNGTFDAYRIRKSLNTATTNLVIDRDINLRWGATALYNGMAGSIFNVTINNGRTVNILGNGTLDGDVSICGTSGTDKNNAGGTFIVNGTLNITGDLFLKNNNNNAGNPRPTSLVIGNTGVVNTNYLNAESHAGDGLSLTINNGGLLKITGADFGLFGSGTGYTYYVNSGSTIEFSRSGNQNIQTPFIFNNLKLSGTGIKTLFGNATVNGTLTMGGTASLSLGTFDLTYGSGAGLEYAGTSAQNASDIEFRYTNGPSVLNINNSNGVNLGTLSNFRNINSLLLNSGKVSLGNNHLVIISGGSITGGSASSYVVTDGTGKLYVNNIGNSSRLFPVGITTSYNPVSITNGASDDFSVAVSSNHNPPNPNKAVTREWDISKTGETAVNTDVIIALQFNNGEWGSQYFTTTDNYIGHYTGGTWTEEQGSIIGTGPFIVTGSGFNSFSPFGVGNQHAHPVSLSTFNSSVKLRSINLNWKTLNEENNSGFDIERKNENSEWVKAGFVSGKNVPSSYEFTDKNLTTGKYQYRLKQIDFNGNYEYHNLDGIVEIGVPAKFDLSQNYPNPFNPVTKINFDLPKSSQVTLKIYDVLGKEVKTLVNEFKDAGYHAVTFEASGLPSGVYFYRISAGEFSAVKKLVLMK